MVTKRLTLRVDVEGHHETGIAVAADESAGFGSGVRKLEPAHWRRVPAVRAMTHGQRLRAEDARVIHHVILARRRQRQTCESKRRNVDRVQEGEGFTRT